MASATHLSAPPVLSTPESHVFEDPTPIVDTSSVSRLTDEQLIVRYEIERTIKEIRLGRWKRIALQFPDEMVGDGVRVYQILKRGLLEAKSRKSNAAQKWDDQGQTSGVGAHDISKLEITNGGADHSNEEEGIEDKDLQLSILADTSYGSCCVDEIAAEHVDAEVVVHYGRSCLSPTARLPVIYVFTTRDLNIQQASEATEEAYSDTAQKIILMADLPYHAHLDGLASRLREGGYSNVVVPSVTHDPAASIPNRKLPADVVENKELLKEFALLHIGQPPPALLLTLTSRVSSIHIYACESDTVARPAITNPTLRRRYALLTSLSTVSIFGILINTLSVKNYLHVVAHVQKLISAAGKKSYTFVVGKVNPAKVANFAEIGGWVVIGCWESSLVESKDFYRPLITPFELELALTNDNDRLWSGEWRSDFDAVLSKKIKASIKMNVADSDDVGGELVDSGEDDESAPPEFDLRTGRYVSHTRPMRSTNENAKSSIQSSNETSQKLIKRANGDLAQVGGVASPGADFLQATRSWKGLGSDYEIQYDAEPGALIEEGRRGVARGYTVGGDIQTRH